MITQVAASFSVAGIHILACDVLEAHALSCAYFADEADSLKRGMLLIFFSFPILNHETM